MEYEFANALPTPDEYVTLRQRAGMSPRTVEAAERGLPNTIRGVVVRDGNGDLVGMGRIVGDDGCFYQIVDVAVASEHQGESLGSRIVEELVDYLHTYALPSAYVSLLSDVEGLYEKFGFQDTAPDSKGMALRIE